MGYHSDLGPNLIVKYEVVNKVTGRERLLSIGRGVVKVAGEVFTAVHHTFETLGGTALASAEVEVSESADQSDLASAA